MLDADRADLELGAVTVLQNDPLIVGRLGMDNAAEVEVHHNTLLTAAARISANGDSGLVLLTFRSLQQRTLSARLASQGWAKGGHSIKEPGS